MADDGRRRCMSVVRIYGRVKISQMSTSRATSDYCVFATTCRPVGLKPTRLSSSQHLSTSYRRKNANESIPIAHPSRLVLFQETRSFQVDRVVIIRCSIARQARPATEVGRGFELQMLQPQISRLDRPRASAIVGHLAWRATRLMSV